MRKVLQARTLCISLQCQGKTAWLNEFTTLGMLTGSHAGTKVATIHLPDDEERWKARDEEGHESDDSFNGQRHLAYGFCSQERL